MLLEYNETSPFTGNKRVMVEWDQRIGDYLMLCMDTGYHTFKAKWAADTEDDMSEMEKYLTAEVTKTRIVKDGHAWYYIHLMNPAVFTVLIPDVDDDGKLHRWIIAPLKESEEGSDSRWQFALMDSDGEPVTYEIDFDAETLVTFSEADFEKAFETYIALVRTIGEMLEQAKLDKK